MSCTGVVVTHYKKNLSVKPKKGGKKEKIGDRCSKKQRFYKHFIMKQHICLDWKYVYYNSLNYEESI